MSSLESDLHGPFSIGNFQYHGPAPVIPETKVTNLSDTRKFSKGDIGFLPLEHNLISSNRPYYAISENLAGDEALADPAREQIRKLYKGLERVLPQLGFESHEINRQDSGRDDIRLIGLPGTYSFRLKSSNNSPKDKLRYIEVRKQVNVPKSKQIDEIVYLFSDGTSYYKKESSEQNKEVPLQKSKELIQAVIDALSNPANSQEIIREKAKEIRATLLDYLKNTGIVPKTTRAFYHFKPGSGLKRDYEYDAPLTYRDVILPGLLGVWNVELSDNAIDEQARAMGITTPGQLIQGLGVILSQDRWAYDKNGTPRYYTQSYVFWENGDFYTPNGHVSSFSAGTYWPTTFNPHGAYIDALELESKLTGKKLPQRLYPPKKPSRIQEALQGIKGLAARFI